MTPHWSHTLLALTAFFCTAQDPPAPAPPPKQDPKPGEAPAAKPTPVQEESKPSPDKQDAAKPDAKGDTAAKKQESVTTPPDDGLEAALAPYLNEGLLGRLLASATLDITGMPEDILANKAMPRLTGERNRLVLLVRNLVDGLGDVRYRMREDSEAALIAMGPIVLPIVEAVQSPDFEIRLRLERVKAALKEAGTEDIVRKALIARGIAEALEYRPGRVEATGLFSALDSLDPRVRLAAIRSLGTMLQNADLARDLGDKLFELIEPDTQRSDLELRNAATATLGGMPTERARTFLSALVADPKRATSHRLLALGVLAERHGADAFEKVAAALPAGDEALRAAADYYKSHAPCRGGPEPAAPVVVKLKDGGSIETVLRGATGDKLLADPSPELKKLGKLRLPRAAIDEVRAAGEPPRSDGRGVLLLLKTGSQLRAVDLELEGDSVTAAVLGRQVKLPRSSLRGIVPDPTRGRALGGSRRSDQVRLVTGEPKLLEGTVSALDDKGLVLDQRTTLRWDQVETVLFQLEAGRAGAGSVGDINQYAQVDLVGSERVVGLLLELDAWRTALLVDSLGCFELPMSAVVAMQLSNSGRALTGFTLVTDYGNMCVVEYDGEGRETWRLAELFDPVDAELTQAGTILVTEQGDNAVREYDRDGKTVWEYTEALSRPVEADRLPNGNTLIVDAGNQRIIEVDPQKAIVWTLSRAELRQPNFKPHDAERLSNGNTLIADSAGDQVIEVTPSAKVVWAYRGAKSAHDADRLPNGNTLITLRGPPPQVIEVTPAQVVIMRITNLNLPWDADRLPDGSTMVAENFGVRIYNSEGKVLRKLEAEWSAESNGY